MSNWYYSENGQKVGPTTLEQLRARVAAGQLRPSDMVWRQGAPSWIPVNSVPELVSATPEGGAEPALVCCTVCGGKVARTAYACPHCGAPQPVLIHERETFKWLLAVVMMLLPMIGTLAAMPVHLPGMYWFTSGFSIFLWCYALYVLIQAGYARYLFKNRPPQQ